MAEHELIEVAVARLDERFNGLQNVISEMASDQRRLTESYEKLVENNQRVGLLEADMLTVKDSNKKLWEKFDQYEAERRKLTSHALYEIVKLLIAIMLGMTLSRYGIHLP